MLAQPSKLLPRVSASLGGQVPPTSDCARPASGFVRPISGCVRPASGSVRPTSGFVRPASGAASAQLSSVQRGIGERLQERAVPHSSLLPVAKYLFSLGGKSLRPRVVSAMAGAANCQGLMNGKASSSDLNTRQQLVMEMVEMYHTASLYHDDVIDAASTRRGKPSASLAWSARTAVLGGDMVLATAYSLLGRIDCEEVTSCMSRAVSDLVAGELLQMAGGLDSSERGLQLYTHKCYLKTGTLFSNSCRSVSLLSSCPSLLLADQAETYGRELGIAFQIVDDMLDYVASSEQLGKPGLGSDLSAGLLTAPLLLAARRDPVLARLLEGGQVSAHREEVVERVVTAGGVKDAGVLAARHGEEALEALQGWGQGRQVEELRKIVTSVLAQTEQSLSQQLNVVSS